MCKPPQLMLAPTCKRDVHIRRPWMPCLACSGWTQQNLTSWISARSAGKKRRRNFHDVKSCPRTNRWQEFHRCRPQYLPYHQQSIIHDSKLCQLYVCPGMLGAEHNKISQVELPRRQSWLYRRNAGAKNRSEQFVCNNRQPCLHRHCIGSCVHLESEWAGAWKNVPSQGLCHIGLRVCVSGWAEVDGVERIVARVWCAVCVCVCVWVEVGHGTNVPGPMGW